MVEDWDFEKVMARMGVDPANRDERVHAEDAPKRTRKVVQKEMVLDEGEERAMFLASLQNLEQAPNKDDTLLREAESEDFRKLKALKNKQLNLEDSLDLHGMTVEQALIEVQQFITKAFTYSLRTVVVITGKGNHSKGGVSVIRRRVEQWILTKGKRFIKSYAEAPRAYGGRGAFIVYLRES